MIVFYRFWRNNASFFWQKLSAGVIMEVIGSGGGIL
jgi:hypothetical protein